MSDQDRPTGSAGATGGDDAVDPALAEAVESAFAGVSDDFPAGSGEAGRDGAAGSGATSGGADAAVPAGTDGAPAGPAGSGESGTADGESGDAEGAPELSALEQAQAAAAQAADDLARARADLYNLQQEYNGFVRRSREAAAGHRESGKADVVEALIPVLDEVELARQHGDLSGPFEAMATKLEGVLADKFGLVRFGEAGEVFDPTLHEALMATESSEVTEPTVALVLQPGYRLGEKVVRAARVQVANPA